MWCEATKNGCDEELGVAALSWDGSSHFNGESRRELRLKSCQVWVDLWILSWSQWRPESARFCLFLTFWRLNLLIAPWMENSRKTSAGILNSRRQPQVPLESIFDHDNSTFIPSSSQPASPSSLVIFLCSFISFLDENFPPNRSLISSRYLLWQLQIFFLIMFCYFKYLTVIFDFLKIHKKLAQ